MGLRAAVIGCGRMGAGDRNTADFPLGWLPITHGDVLKSTAGVKLAALCDTDGELLQKAGSKYGVDSLFEDSADLQADVVSIATRTPSKLALIRQFHGSKLYVEKPLANSLADCREAVKSPMVYGVNRRYHIAYRKAKQLVQDGVIGDITQIAFEFGRSPLLWCHPHTVDLAVFFLGTDITSVHARVSGEVQADPVQCDPIVEHARFTWANGSSALLTQGSGCNTRIYGSEATMTIHADGASIQIDRGTGYRMNTEFIHTGEAPSASQVAMSELVRGVVTPADEILTGMQMLFACVHSHRLGRPVSLDEVPDSLCVLGCTNGKYA
jgi:scyllo-inositol 2-dehydrogenase (NAD+)